MEYKGFSDSEQAPIALCDRAHSDGEDGLGQLNPFESDAVERGRAAWGTLKKTWEHWLAVGEALAVGRAIALAEAETDRPTGARYERAMAAWLKANGFDEIDPATRCRLFDALENRDEIEKWRATLAANQRLKWNHPDSVLQQWKRATQSPEPAGERKPTIRETAAALQEENDALHAQLEKGGGGSRDAEWELTEARRENERLRRQVDALQKRGGFDPHGKPERVATAIFATLGTKASLLLARELRAVVGRHREPRKGAAEPAKEAAEREEAGEPARSAGAAMEPPVTDADKLAQIMAALRAEPKLSHKAIARLFHVRDRRVAELKRLLARERADADAREPRRARPRGGDSRVKESAQ